MRRLTPIVVSGLLAGLAAGCLGFGSIVGEPQGTNMPPGGLPRAVHGAPPDAYIEFGRPGRWMVQGSSCWSSGNTGRCVDTVPPEDMPGLPVLLVRPGTAGRIHLGFVGSKPNVSIGGKPVPVHGSRTLTFRATRQGVLVAFANADQGDATYVVRIRFR